MNSAKWLSTLITSCPQEGFELAIKLSKVGLQASQSDLKLSEKYEPVLVSEVMDVTISSQLIALNFHTIALANNYWR